MELNVGGSVTVDEVVVRVEGAVARASVTVGSRAVSVRGTRGDDVVADLLAGADLRVAASVDVEVRQMAPGTSRGGASDAGTGTIVLEAPPLRDGEHTHVALIEEDGELRWEWPGRDGRQFVVEIDEEADVQRGILGTAIRKAIKFVAVKAVKPTAQGVVRSLAAAAEKRLRPSTLRTFSADDYRLDDADVPDIAAYEGKPALLLLHGTNSQTASGFARLDSDWVRAVNERYEGRVFAFDHPTLSVSPADNADRFGELVRERLGDDDLVIDVLAHSRGGLVARELSEHRRDRVTVRSITFVATPNNGTPLASADHLGSFVDVMTNLAAVVPDNPVTDSLQVILELVKDIALDIAFDALPGVKSMTPDGAYLATLNETGAPDGVPYRAVAANFEPLTTAGVLTKLRDRLFDHVFDGAMNDLVVPTRSAYLRSGEFHVPAEQRIVLDSTRGIDHSNFWQELDVLGAFDGWLAPEPPDDDRSRVDPATSDPRADLESAMERADGSAVSNALDTIRDLPRKFQDLVGQLAGGSVPAPRPTTGADGDVVLLPGIMGSLLRTEDGLVWISPLALRRGAFGTLTLDRPTHTAEAVGLNTAYTKMAGQLSGRWRVHLFPYDWRLDIDDAADALDEFITARVMEGGRRPVHLVAHSMGGLVARTFIGRHRDTWDAMDDGGGAGGRLVMLGTPNRGSYSIPLALSGEDIAVKGLAAVDRRNDRDDIRRIVASFPGTYQMLPSPHLELAFPDDHDRLYDAAAWGDVDVDPDLLTRAREFHDWLEAGHDDSSPERMVYVAGDRRLTPGRITIERGVQHYGQTDEGDGRVLHASGILDGSTTFYVDETHGDLASADVVLSTIDEILATGTTEALRTERFPRRGADGPSAPTARIPAADVDPEPLVREAARGAPGVRLGPRGIDEVMSHAVSLYLGRADGTAPTGDRAVRVSVKHTSLEQAAHPVIVGHYRGIPPEGAEGFLDDRLDGALTRHFDLDDYPSEPGESLLVMSNHDHPTGGIVVGLGAFGELTRSKLVASIRSAAKQRTLYASERGQSGVVGVSAVLVGSPGQYGLSLEVAVDAIVEGFARAVEDLAGLRLGGVRLGELELVELYEVRAVRAAERLRRVADSLPVDVRAEVDLRVGDRLAVGRGGRPGLPSSGGSGAAWPRFVIDRKLPPCPPAPTSDDDAELPYPCGDDVERPLRTLPSFEFTQLGRGSQLDRLRVEFDDEKITRMIRSAITNPESVDETYALFEMLFPHEQKLEIDDTDNLQLLLDEDAAAIPWELLCGRGDGAPSQALALRTGMLRQLRPTDGAPPVRRTGRPPLGDRALVIGDPPAGDRYPRLPGARNEAREVARMLRESGYEVEELVFDDQVAPSDSWLRIQAALYRYPYRVIHFATHGDVDPSRPERSGLQLSPDVRLTALDIQQMSATPDLVFVNACHLGRTGQRAGATRTAQRVNELASNLSLQLMRNGVRAVIAAGWAVDDQAALRFARTAYENLLSGQRLGVAVHQARNEAFDGGRTNTWGAYQCYGDPSFAIRRGSGRRSGQSAVSASQLIERLDNAAVRAGDAQGLAWQRSVHEDVVWVDDNDVAHFAETPVYEALGRAYRELGCYADAVWAFDQAASVDAGHGRIALQSLEQLANMEVRLAADRWRGRQAPLPPVHQPSRPPRSLFGDARKRLDGLVRFEATAERLSLLGSLHKKYAATAPSGSGRTRRIDDSRHAYRDALTSRLEMNGQLDSYSGCNWIQLSTLLDDGSALALQRIVLAVLRAQLDGSLRLDRHPESVARLTAALKSGEDVVGDDLAELGELATAALEASEPAPGSDGSSSGDDGFWTVASRGDHLLTEALLDVDSDEAHAHLDEAGSRYTHAFADRSTVRQRDSVLEHLRDLRTLVPADLEQPIGDLLADLEGTVASGG